MTTGLLRPCSARPRRPPLGRRAPPRRPPPRARARQAARLACAAHRRARRRGLLVPPSRVVALATCAPRRGACLRRPRDGLREAPPSTPATCSASSACSRHPRTRSRPRSRWCVRTTSRSVCGRSWIPPHASTRRAARAPGGRRARGRRRGRRGRAVEAGADRDDEGHVQASMPGRRSGHRPETKKPCNGPAAPGVGSRRGARSGRHHGGNGPAGLDEADEAFAPVVATEETAAVESEAPEASAESAAPEEAPQSLTAVMNGPLGLPANEVEPPSSRPPTGSTRRRTGTTTAWATTTTSEYDEAIEAFEKAIEVGYSEDAASYNIACGYALLGKTDQAFHWLDKAADAGFDLSRLHRRRRRPRQPPLRPALGGAQEEAARAEGRAARGRGARPSRRARSACVAKAPKSGEPYFDMGRSS